MKIRTAIFGVYVAASAIGFLLLMAFVLRDVRNRYVESMRRTLGDTAAFLATFAAEGASAGGDQWIRRLESLPPKADLLRIFACDRDGRVLFDSANGQDLGQIYTWPMTGGGRFASQEYTVPNVSVVDDELRVAAPVRRGPERIGWVGVGRRLATVSEGVSLARTRLMVVAGLIAAGMVAVGWIISTRLTHALERLTVYAQEVRAGKLATPPASRAAEIDALSRAFEEMRVALEGKAYVERYTQALAHEFKAPLSAIRGAAELLGENPPEPDRQRFLANLRAETERLQRIVDRLLELAALESRRAEVMSEVDLVDIVTEAHDAAQPAAATRGISLSLSIDAPARVRGEAFLIGQSIGNLVQNALDFTPRGGTVAVSLRSAGGRAIVGVQDTGPGVPDYALEKIFDRFYSLPRPDTGRKSSGLGLSIVREIARLHGGDATLENRPEGGARAELRLPLV